LLSALGFPVKARAENAEGTAPRAASTPSSGDVTEGQLIPLTPIASRFGVIVTITGSHINIVRRDGTELRLKGLLPGDAVETDNAPVLLLQQGDAWVRPLELPQLLGLRDDADLEAGISQTSLLKGAFESFEVKKPVVYRPAPQKKSAEPDRHRRLPTMDTLDGGGFVQTETSPVEVGLGVSRLSSFSTPEMAGLYQEVVGPSSSAVAGAPRQLGDPSPVDRTLSYLSVEVYEGDRFFFLGDVSDPLFGPATGFDLRSVRPDGAWLGAAVVAPVEPGSAHRDGQFALRAGMPSSDGLGGEVSFSADGSHLLVGEWQHAGTSFRASLLDCFDLQRRDLSWSHLLLPATKVFGRHAQAQGDYDAATQLLGIEWRLGRARLGVEQHRGVSAGETWGSDALSLSLLQKRTTASLRYVLAQQDSGRQGMEWFISRFDSSGRQVYFSSTAPAAASLQGGRTYRLGASLPVKEHVRSRVSVELGAGGFHPEGKLEWRPSRDKVVSLRYGLLDQELVGTGAERGLVLQGSFAFGGAGLPPRGTGRIVGRVRDDASRGVADVAVVLEEVAVTFTRADGSFEFKGVPVGRQRVKLDQDRLHADLGGAPSPRTVFVQQDGAERADFVVTRLCRVAGRVYVQSPSREHREPVVGAVVELSGGRRATTNSEGAYSFDSLPPGPYAVSFASSTDASTITPTSPTSWSFRLRPGDQVAEADFVFEWRARPVVFDAIAE
jgi:hypothetical protein